MQHSSDDDGRRSAPPLPRSLRPQAQQRQCRRRRPDRRCWCIWAAWATARSADPNRAGW